MLQCEGGLWFVKNIIYVLSNIVSKKCQMSGQKSRIFKLCVRIESTLFDPDIIQLHLKLIELYNIYVEWMVWRWRWWYRSFITTRNKKDDNKMLSDCYIY